MENEEKEPAPSETEVKDSGFAKRMQDIDGVVIIKAKDVVLKKDREQ
jgi:hypothetical protein